MSPIGTGIPASGAELGKHLALPRYGLSFACPQENGLPHVLVEEAGASVNVSSASIHSQPSSRGQERFCFLFLRAAGEHVPTEKQSGHSLVPTGLRLELWTSRVLSSFRGFTVTKGDPAVCETNERGGGLTNDWGADEVQPGCCASRGSGSRAQAWLWCVHGQLHWGPGLAVACPGAVALELEFLYIRICCRDKSRCLWTQ